tara:strand:- start:6711 stop:7664 length:954 start_codon:yes stop_codon:yes gene_type:complete
MERTADVSLDIQSYSHRYIKFQLDDIDTLTRTFQAAPLNCIQTTPGVLGARLYDVSTSRLEVRDAAYAEGVSLTLSDPFPRFALGISLGGDVQVQGVNLNTSNVSYISGANGMIARLKPGARWCNICIDWNLLESAAEVQRYAPIAGDNYYGMPVRIHNQLAATLSSVAQGTLYAEKPDEELEDSLVHAVLHALNAGSGRATYKTNLDRRKHNVHTVIEFIRAEYSRPVTITALCRLTGVSERTLQYHFKMSVGLSIQQYLMHYRLQRARALLLRGHFEHISEVASACGIHHLGRFSQYYRRLFGELPRATLVTSFQ